MNGKAKSILIVLLVVALLSGLLGYCAVRDGDVAVARRAPASLAVFYTCDTRGHIEPCSCSEGIAGGVARRKAFLAAQAAPHRILVDAGNVTAGARDWELVELRHILRAYDAMGYDAVNAGHREATLSADRLRKVAVDYGRLVSANLLDGEGKPILPPYRIAQLDGGYRIGILGVVDDTLAADEVGAGVRIAPPEDAIAKYLPEVVDKSDFVVLLAFADEERMKALAEHFYEIDVIVGGDVQQPSGTPVEVNRSVLAYITDKGKGVGRMDLALGPEGAKVTGNSIQVLTEEVQPDAETAAILDAYKRDLLDVVEKPEAGPLHDDEEGLSEITSSRSHTADTFAGSDACKACHPNAYAVWLGSAHARAYATLVERGGETDPACLACHTAGHGASDGFVSARLSPATKDVTCEACHGRGAYHARLQAGQPVPVKRVFMKTVECTTCHDEKNSPRFAMAEYWEKIEHDKS